MPTTLAPLANKSNDKNVSHSSIIRPIFSVDYVRLVGFVVYGGGQRHISNLVGKIIVEASMTICQEMRG